MILVLHAFKEFDQSVEIETLKSLNYRREKKRVSVTLNFQFITQGIKTII